MTDVRIRRHDLALYPDSSRVIMRPFISSNSSHVIGIIGRVLALSDEEAARELESVHAEFAERHHDFTSAIEANFRKIEAQVFTQRPLSDTRRHLIGAMFSGEYALESAALFNPSIVAHPDQAGVPQGGLRFIMSLRATGEGHVSSIEFRTGELSPAGKLVFDDLSHFVSAPEIVPNPTYRKQSFIIKLFEMGLDNEHAADVMQPLADNFTLSELDGSVSRVRREHRPVTRELKKVLESIHWLATSNYELHFDPGLAMSERVIFPVSHNESNGIEDARFVRFVDQGGEVMYYATYTAYNGHTILPQLMETHDFTDFRVLTLNGSAVQNKGMALFPRRINGHYAMLSRQDDENIYIMLSDNPHYWSDPRILLRPAHQWECVKLGNCGSPIETEAGWLLLTHGVGAMRKYCIGAALLDLNEPTKVIGRLQKPLLVPEGDTREGYVPNVVYSCGSLLHRGQLILPYGMSDRVTAVASVCLSDLLMALTG